jgi:hypothetical protein
LSRNPWPFLQIADFPQNCQSRDRVVLKNPHIVISTITNSLATIVEISRFLLLQMPKSCTLLKYSNYTILSSNLDVLSIIFRILRDFFDTSILRFQAPCVYYQFQLTQSSQ